MFYILHCIKGKSNTNWMFNSTFVMPPLDCAGARFF